jgi:hypothetical protein
VSRKKPVDPDDPTFFLRDFGKLQTDLLGDDYWRRLTLEQRGVFDDLCRWSTVNSRIPGFFLHKNSGIAMTENEIVYGVAGCFEHQEGVREAMKVFLRMTGAMSGYRLWGLEQSPSDGYQISNFEDRFSTSPERMKIRLAAASRQAKKAARDKAIAKAGGAPTPIRSETAQ